MGCVKSKNKRLIEPNLFIFDVTFADTSLNQFFNGKLEITGSLFIFGLILKNSNICTCRISRNLASILHRAHSVEF